MKTRHDPSYEILRILIFHNYFAVCNFSGGDPLEKEIKDDPADKKTDGVSDSNSEQNPEKKRKGGIISDFLFAFVLTFFLLLTLVMIGTKILGYQMLTIDSGSMEPNMPVDSLIFVKQTDPSALQRDDVITFTIDTEGTLVTHRIVSVHPEDRIFITKGDANNTNDAPVSWSNVVGKTELCLPKIGGIFRAFTAEKNRVYVYIAIGVLAGLMILWIILDHLKKKKHRKRAISVPEEKDKTKGI